MSTYDGYIERLARKVDARLQDIESIFNFDLGDEFEVAICALLEDILPAKYGVCRGFVVAKNGDKAGDDLIIYDKMSSPTLRSGMIRKLPVKEQILLMRYTRTSSANISSLTPLPWKRPSLRPKR